MKARWHERRERELRAPKMQTERENTVESEDEETK